MHVRCLKVRLDKANSTIHFSSILWQSCIIIKFSCSLFISYFVLLSSSLYFYALAVIHFGVGTTSLQFKMWWVTGHVLIAPSAFLVMAWLHNVTVKWNMVPALSAKNVSLEKHILMLIILDLAFHVEFVPNMKKSTINAIWHQIQSAENVTKASIVKD